MRILTLSIDERAEGRTVGNLLKRELGLSASLISHLKYRPTGITVGGVQVHTTAKLRRGDLLCVDLSDAPSDQRPATEGVPLHILYEDEDLLLINKPAGMEMHPDYDQLRNPSVKDSVLHYLGKGSVFHPVNRLDIDTSGLLAVAKHRHACDKLRRQLHTADFRREYLALCEGIPPKDDDILDAPVGNLPAKTHYRVLAKTNTHALVRLQLYTGRTHQIRIHMAEIGCPLAGDSRYGAPSPLIGRTALHSALVSLKQPITNEPICLFCPPPEDFLAALRGMHLSSDSLTPETFCDITELLTKKHENTLF